MCLFHCVIANEFDYRTTTCSELYCKQLIVWTLNMNYDRKNKAILYHADISKRYFSVCHLKIVLYFLHELKQKSRTSGNNTLRLLLDRHAPIMSKKVLFRPKVPWINSDIIKAKRQRRKVERKWRTTRCQSDLILFKKRRNYVTFLMNKARQQYFQ